ncbi:hypothetical protein [Gramella sp. AN32]|uniref:Uncharacterized protein n=1 Tax=Christiangramia antarctica TaxID=2058158 RepID=A0ABW5X4F9_9FLAO|nr:hypothetical protein [Gramella sp. AN32]MCM4156362.1 hypothetical protein [Gramella sp. AN32]
MKVNVLLLLVFISSLNSCDAQEKKEMDSAMKVEKNQDTVRPEGSWTVNREFDDDGNLISYDSTYVYSYSTIDGDTISTDEKAEIQKNFRQFFNRKGMNSPDEMMNLFLNDSLFSGNFFKDDFFSNNMRTEDFREQVRRMDSIHQQFLQQYYPQFSGESKKRIPREKGPNEKSI